MSAVSAQAPQGTSGERAHARRPVRDVVVLVNPASGRGRGEAVGEAVAAAITADGHAVRTVTVRHWDALVEACEDANALVICGGDGTVHHALELLIHERDEEAAERAERGARFAYRANGRARRQPDRRSLEDLDIERPRPSPGPAVYHVPLGTENLFAREFGMTGAPSAVAAALRAWRVREIDLGRCRGWPFAIMVGVGPDAEVIHRMDEARTGAISHISYVGPVLGVAMRPRVPRLRVRVDGRIVVNVRRGSVIVANSRQYALRVDPCRRAVVDDGLLDIAFLPARTTLEAAGLTVLSRLRLHERIPGVVIERGTRVLIETIDAPAPVQIDGETGGDLPPGAPMEISIEPKAARVLMPA